jgi:hypothetical protein
LPRRVIIPCSINHCRLWPHLGHSWRCGRSPERPDDHIDLGVELGAGITQALVNVDQRVDFGMDWCRDAAKIDKTRLATLTKHRRVARACQSSLHESSSEASSRCKALLIARCAKQSSRSVTHKIPLSPAGSPVDTTIFSRDRLNTQQAVRQLFQRLPVDQ